MNSSNARSGSVKALLLACVAILGIAVQSASAAPHGNAAKAAAKAGYSLTPSATEPYATCAKPKPGRVACMSVVIPPAAVSTQKRPAPDIGRPRGRFAPLFDSPAPLAGGVGSFDLEGSGQEGGFSPADLRSAYRIPSSGGSGQTIAIVVAYDYPSAESDLKVFRSQYGLPECTAANGCFRKINQEGKTSSYPAPEPGWAAEAALDLDMASASCPSCKILLVEAKNNEWENMGKAVETAATYTASGWPQATVISNSWGADEFRAPWWWEPESQEEEEEMEAVEKEYEEFQLSFEKYITHPGTPVLFSGGDTGFVVSYPASSPNVVSVGGTALYEAPHTERGWFEATWTGSGGGCSRYVQKPAWQTDTGCAKRMTNDVAAVSSPSSPVSVYDSYQAPGWILAGGTSAAAPIVAGVEALSSAGFREEGAQAFWKNQKSLFDVTTGFNWFEDCVPQYFCNGGPGYDGPTGNGTPNVEGGGEGLPRKWTTVPTPRVESESNDVSCVSSSFCMEVGADENSEMFEEYPEGVVGAKVWDGSEWLSTADIATVAGGKRYVLNSVSCTSSTSCIAVGRYTNESGTWVTLAESWNGSTWSIQSTPNPSGATKSFLTDVSCTTTSACMAIGVDNKNIPFAERWNGSEWLVESLPMPSGAKTASALDVSCGSSTFCIATGRYTTEGDKGASLVYTWNGSSWSYQKIEPNKKVENPTFERSELSAVSCPSASFCTAVGEYRYSWSEKGGNYKASETLVETWDSSKWAQQAGVSAPGGPPALSSISCTSPSFCEAVGWQSAGNFGSVRIAMAERWNGSTWSVEKIPSSELWESSFFGVSCSAPAACMATGRYRPIGYSYGAPHVAVGLEVSGSTLSLKPVTAPAESKAVSCASQLACVEVGGGMRYGSASVWNGAKWSLWKPQPPTGATSSTLTGVSCTSTTGCEAVGSYVDSTGTRKTLVEHGSNEVYFRFLDWSVQTTPNPAGAKSSSLSGVSCSSDSACTAVGTYTDEGGPQRTLAERWNGSEWSIQSTPNPAGAKAASLSGVSCSTASACTAVGTYTDSGGTQRTLAETWNGSEWSIQSTPNPAGAKAASLSAVSCTSASSCTAVGTYTDEGGTQRTLAVYWNGTIWSIQNTPNPSGFKAASLSGVSCAAPGSCAAVGTYTDSSGNQLTLGENWNGSTWSIQSTPNPEGAKAAALNGVSCSDSLCMSTGSVTGKNSVKTSIAQARWGTGPRDVTTEAATFSSKGEPQLNGTVNPDGLATSYRFEYGATSSYGTTIPLSPKEVGSGKTPVKVTQTISESLKPGAAYHFRLAASNELGTSYGADMTFTTSPNLHWFACTKQTGGRYLTSACTTEGTSQWELLHLKEGEKVNVTAKGNPIAFTSTQAGVKVTFSCETEVASPSLENPSGGGNGLGSAEVKYKGCKGEGTMAEKGCKVENTANYASKVEASMGEGNAQVVLKPSSGETLAKFNVTSCSIAALNGTWELKGTLQGLYSNASSLIEFTTESTGQASLTLRGQKTTAVGSIKLEAAEGGYVKALGQPRTITEVASGIEPDKATLNGTVNPEGGSAIYYFEYGKTTSYGQKAPLEAKDAGEGLTDVKVAETISGLIPGTTYNYRLVATNGTATSYGINKTLTTTAVPMHWFACTKQTGGRYTSSACTADGPAQWELLHLKEGEKVNVTAKGNPIAFTSTQAGVKAIFSCETEVASPSLENPSGGGTGLGSAEVKYKGCKGEGTMAEKGCKVENTANYASKLELTTVEGQAHVLLKPSSGETLAKFNVTSCSIGALNSAWELKGTLKGPYSNASSKIEFTTESTGQASLTLRGQKTTAEGSIKLEAAEGGHIKALGQPFVTTEAASGIEPDKATLNGTVNPEGASALYYFEYGKTTSYGQKAPLEAKDAGEGLTDVKVAETIGGLVPGTKYHYRLVATNGTATSYGIDKTLTTTAVPMHWFACTEQAGGKYATNACDEQGVPNQWDLVALQEGEKVNVISFIGNTILFTSTQAGVKTTFSCKFEVANTSLENPSGGGTGLGSAEVKYKDCKGIGIMAEKGCKVENTANYASKLELTTVEGNAQVVLKPASGETFAKFSVTSCSISALNSAWELKGTMKGLYSNAGSMIQFTTESTGQASLTLRGQKATAVGATSIETSGGGYIKAQ